MPLAGLLLFSMLLSAPADLIGPAQPTGTGQSSYLSSDNGVMPAQSFQLTPSTPADDGALAPADNVCYKIRAYIFKRDDDHAPEFVRSTTCGPNKPHTKDATWPKARMVPAD
jgi:hypothetical protein